MSKYDNLFKNNSKNTGNTGNSGYNSNSTFTSKSKYNSFVSSSIIPVKSIYDYKAQEFPDLKPDVKASLTPEVSMNKKYSDIAATILEKELITEILVQPGWVQYSRSNVLNKHNLFDEIYGSLTKEQIEEQQIDAKKADPLYIHQQMISTLTNTWSRYKMQYDLLHGEDAYDLVYYTEPIYSLDENENEYETDKVIYDYNNYDSQEEYNPKNWA